MMKERALLLCWHLANSSQRFLSWALSTDTCRLIIFVRWISVGGKWLSKGKLTAGRGSKARDQGVVGEHAGVPRPVP